MTILSAILAFFQTKLGEWLLILGMVAAALFAGAVYERNIQHEKDLADYAKEKADQAKVDAKAYAALDAKYRKEEADHKADVVAIGKDYEKKLAISQTQHDVDLAAARAGSLSLSIPATACSDGGVSSASGSPSESPAEARIQLPREVTASLYGIADDANGNTDQLAACQAILLSERKPHD